MCSQSPNGKHDDYLDREVTINGKRYKVYRCRHCGREVYR